MPKTAAERNRIYRKRLAEKGAIAISLTVDGATAQRLRTLAREHQQTMEAVQRLASLHAQRALAEPSPRLAE